MNEVCVNCWQGVTVVCAVGCREWDECCDKKIGVPCPYCTAGALVNLQRLVLMSVTEHDHECRGKCPDEDMPDSRDPDCLACAAIDFGMKDAALQAGVLTPPEAAPAAGGDPKERKTGGGVGAEQAAGGGAVQTGEDG